MSMTFPVSASKTDALQNEGIAVTTTIHLFKDGLIVVNVDAHEWTDLRGGHFAVVVRLLGDPNVIQPPLLETTQPVRYGLDGKWIGTSTLSTSFKQQIDADTMQNVQSAEIYNRAAPDDIWNDMSKWIDGLGKGVGLASSVVKLVHG